MLALLQFIYNRSLWGDESMLAYGIMTTPISELNHSLPFHQVGPWLYLMLLKISYGIYPASEMSIRIWSLGAYAGALFFFYKSIRHYFKDSVGIQSIGLALFVYNYMLVYYSSELKHYAFDVLVSSFFIYGISSGLFNGTRGRIVLFVSSVLSVLISGAAPLVLPVVFLVLFFLEGDWKKGFTSLLGPGIALILCFGLYYFFHLKNFDGGEFMKNYWMNKEPAFMPLNLFSPEFSAFFYAKQLMLFEYVFRFGFGASMALRILFVLGIVQLMLRKQFNLLLLLSGSLLIHLLFSAFTLYPFHIRFTLYLIPGLIILCLQAFHLFPKISALRWTSQPLVYLPLVLFLFAGLLNFKISGFPFQKEEVRRSYLLLSKDYRSGDFALFNESHFPAWNYYTKSGIVKLPDSFKLTYFSPEKGDFKNSFETPSGASRVWLLSNYLIADTASEFLTHQQFKLVESFPFTQSELRLFEKAAMP